MTPIENEYLTVIGSMVLTYQLITLCVFYGKFW